MLSGCGEGETAKDFDSSAFMALQWPQNIESSEQPVDIDANPFRENYIVVLDMSGSMNEDTCSGKFKTKIEGAKDALNRWVERVPSDAAVGLVVFNEEGIFTAVEPLPNNKRNFIETLATLNTGGGTPLSSAIAEGYQQLENRGRAQNGIGNYRMLVVTDGGHSAGYDPTNNINWIIRNTPIDMFTVGFCITGSALNQPGKTFYVEADSPEKLFEGLSAALAETPSFILTDFE